MMSIIGVTGGQMVQPPGNKMHWEFYSETEIGVKSKFMFWSYSGEASQLHPFKLVQLGLENAELMFYLR